jgi:hypothetical protein
VSEYLTALAGGQSWGLLREESRRYWQRVTVAREAEEQDRREWIDGLKERWGLVTIGEPPRPGGAPGPRSGRVGVSLMVLFGGHVRELIHVDKAFLITAIQDARSWCREMEPWGPGQTSGSLAGYDAALAVLEAEPP